MTNMGTTSSPEGLPHYLPKHFLAQRLGKCLRDDVGFWFCFVEQCNACDGGFVIENILEGVRRIEYETPFLGYQPDILLWGKSEEKPLRAVEVVATSEPSAGKRRIVQGARRGPLHRAVPHGGASSSRQAVHRRLLHTAGGRPSLLPAQGEEEAEESLRRLEAQDDARFGVHLASLPSPFPTGMDRPHYYHHAGRLRQGDSEAVECYAQHAQYDRATGL